MRPRTRQVEPMPDYADRLPNCKRRILRVRADVVMDGGIAVSGREGARVIAVSSNGNSGG